VNTSIRSSPHFFRLIKRAFLLGWLLLLGLALLIPAPLEAPADMGRVPNPAKSAWFLLWMQELVSYSKYLVYLVGGMAIGLALLPWWPSTSKAEGARWLAKEQRLVNCLTLTVLGAIVTLTGIAMFFRGENWSFVLPF
jgi:hypothetical protein